MSASRRLLAVVASTCLVAALSVACSGTDANRPSTDSRLVWGKAAEARVLDPAVSTAAVDWELLRLTYENLVDLDDKLGVVPELAESWKQTSPTKYTFTLRKGVKFSNGREMTADDVAGSLERISDPKLATFWSGQLGIESATALDADHVEVTLKAPRTSFVAALAGSPAAVLPMKELDEGTFDPDKQLLGTGPFMVSDHSQNESWTFVTNPHYWRPGIPKVNDLIVRIMPDDATRIAALRDGTIDVTTFENTDAVQLLDGQSNVETVVQQTGDYYVAIVNAKNSIFKDDRLRQALSLAIDRTKIKDVGLGGVGGASAAISPAFPGVCDPEGMPFAQPDLEQAKQLVDAAGASGKTVEVITRPTIPMTQPIAEVIQQNLQAIGLKVKLVSMDAGEVAKHAYSGSPDFDILLSWFAGYADPAMGAVIYNPDLVRVTAGWTASDPKLNNLINESLAEPQGEQRTATLKEVCTRIANNGNMIPLVTKNPIVAFRKDRVAPAIAPVEGYAVPLRHLAEFGTD